MSLRKSVMALAAVAMAASTAHAVMTVNTNLGNLGAGSFPLSGTTVGQPNNADTYAPVGNPAAIWDQEYVYQFSTTQQMIASLTSNDPNGASVDNDFFLLNSLNTVLNVNNLQEATVVPSQTSVVEVSGSYGIIPAGTYYLSIDAWRGNPTAVGTPPTGRAGPYNANLNLAAIVAPSATSVFLGGSLSGNLGAGEVKWYSFSYGGGAGFTIDTEGSAIAPSNDTELGLYDSSGNLLVEDDDGGTGLLSLLDSGPLPAGTYYLAMGGFNTTFGAGWQATSTSTNSGPFNINGIMIPEPGTLTLAGAAGLLALRRRRA